MLELNLNKFIYLYEMSAVFAHLPHCAGNRMQMQRLCHDMTAA